MGKTRDLFKKTGYTTWIFHENMGTIKERNVKKLTEAEDIKKRWQEYTEDLSKKCLNDSDNHDSVVTSVQFCHSVVSHSLWPHESQGGQASLSITNSRSAPKPMSIELVMPSNHFIFWRPLLHLPSIFPSIRVFSNESALHIKWPKYWRISFNISTSNEDPGMISFRMDWLDLLAVQGTLKSLLQHISSLTLSFLYSPTLIYILDHWKKHSLN